MSQEIELIQVILKVDGTLCRVILPDECKELFIGMLPGFFQDGKIAAAKLPPDFKMVRLADL